MFARNIAVMRRPKQKTFRKTFIREWRKLRGLTLEQLSSRLEEAGDRDLGQSGLSMLERGQRAYTQQTLEAIAIALQTDTASLLMRDPSREDPNDPNSIWSLWDRAKPGERRQILGVTRALLDKTGS